MTAQPFTPTGSLASGAAFRWLLPAMEMAALVSGNWPPMPDPGPSGWTCYPRVATRTLSVEARSAGTARDFAVATARRWGESERCGDIATVVSELLTNALRHAGPAAGKARTGWPIRLGLLQPGPCVLCAVADPSDQPPAPKELGYLAETGRGLQVVGALSDQWGFTAPSGHGKVVWALFLTRSQPCSEPWPVPSRLARGERNGAAGLTLAQLS